MSLGLMVETKPSHSLIPFHLVSQLTRAPYAMLLTAVWPVSQGSEL